MTTTPTPAATAQSLSDRVAEEVRAMMARRRVTGARLARQLGVSPAWVSYRLTGAQPIDLNDLSRIAEVLDVPIVQLLPAELRNQVRVAYPFRAGLAPKPIIRAVPSAAVARPPTFGQKSAGRKIDTRPPGHPGTPLRRAA